MLTKPLKPLLLLLLVILCVGLALPKACAQKSPLLGDTLFKPQDRPPAAFEDTAGTMEVPTVAPLQLSLDSGRVDSVKRQPTGDLKTSVKYAAQDSMVFNIQDKTFFLYTKSQVDYDDVTLAADKINLNWQTAIVNATGTPNDSTGRIMGIPVFQQGDSKYQAHKIKYNYKTRKGVIRDVVTQQGEGYIHGRVVKRNPNNEFFADSAQYTTCNLEHPHYFINSRKIKMIPGDKVITGPFNLVVQDIPLPLGFAFGLFPMAKKRSAGIIIPTYGDSRDQGFFLRNGGYFLPIGETVNLAITGDIYSKGTYGLGALTTYKKLYKFNGTADVRIRRQLSNQDTENESIASSYWVTWNHAPETKGNSRFTANVQLGTSDFNQRYSFNRVNQINSNYSSSVSFTQQFPNSKILNPLVLSATQSQNGQNGSLTVSLPNLNWGINRINPFLKKDANATTWYEKLNFTYNVTGRNILSNAPVQPLNLGSNIVQADPITPVSTIYTPLTLGNINELLGKLQTSATHTIPISTTFAVFKYINLSPQFNYTETWFNRRYNFLYDEVAQGVRTQNITGFSRFYSFNTSVAASTQLYGMFYVKRGRFEAIRHTLIPNVSFSYAPDFSDPKWGIYQNVRINQAGQYQRITTVPTAFGGPSLGRTGNINFALNNIVEAKVKPRKVIPKAEADSLAKKNGGAPPQFEKINLLQNLSVGGSYNLLADSNNLSLSPIAANTTLFKIVNTRASFALDPYAYNPRFDESGKVISSQRTRFYRAEKGMSPVKLNQVDVAFGVNLNSDKLFGQDPKNDKLKQAVAAGEIMTSELPYIYADPSLYLDWNTAWNLNIDYKLTYTQIGFNPSQITQTVNANGDVTVTKNLKITYSSGWDFTLKKPTTPRFSVIRDLHCWEFRLNTVPFGRYTSYSFDLAVKASVLQDLKLSRTRNFVDR